MPSHKLSVKRLPLAMDLRHTAPALTPLNYMRPPPDIMLGALSYLL